MTSFPKPYSHSSWSMAARLAAILLLLVVIISCSTESEPPQTMQEKYQLSDDEAWLWDQLYVAEAETTATVFWSLLGQGRFDEAMLMIERFDDPRMTRIFKDKMENLWSVAHRWPADDLTEEPPFELGTSETVGFRTWGELWQSGFQRAVLCEDSITVYFVFNGYWQTDSSPLYAAVCCGDFGEQSPQWRPFPITVFSIDESEPTKKVYGMPVRCQTLDQFCDFLRKRTYGTFGI